MNSHREGCLCVGCICSNYEIEIESLRAKVAELEADLGNWKLMVGRILSTIPTSKVIRATGTISEVVEYFKNIHNKLADEQDKVKVLTDALEDCLTGIYAMPSTSGGLLIKKISEALSTIRGSK